VESAQVLAGTPAAAREIGAGGACTLIDDEALLDDALATSPPDAAVQMLDAGELLIHVSGQTIRVAPRYVPEILPFVSGVVYETEAQALDPLEGDDSFIAAFGGQQIGRFLAPAEVPATPRILSLNGAAPEARPRIERDSDLAVTWTADAAPRGAVALVIAAETGPALRCLAADSGRFVIPRDAMARGFESIRSGPLTLAVERTRRTPFSTPGLDAAEIEVTVRDVVGLR
jgi:hypothetical protein